MKEWMSLIPHLKLPPGRLLEVLKAVSLNEPERRAVSRAILSQFPAGKSEKSVVRGMALPATTRLHLVRTDLETIRLAPNGVGVFRSGLVQGEYVGLVVRALAVRRLGIPPTLVENPATLKMEASRFTEQTRERIGRFTGYLERFPVHRGVWKSSGFALLPDTSYALRPDDRQIRNILRIALPRGAFVELDQARTLVLDQAWQQKWLATSFDADAWFLRDASSDTPVVYLWKQATRSLGEIFHQGRSYGGLTVRG